MTEDEMVGWHNSLNEHEFEQAPGDGEGLESLVCCNPWGRKESDTAEQLNNHHCCFPLTNVSVFSFYPLDPAFELLLEGNFANTFVSLGRGGDQKELQDQNHMLMWFCVLI